MTPLTQLEALLLRWFALASDVNPEAEARFAKEYALMCSPDLANDIATLLGNVDAQLTGKRRASVHAYIRDAQRVLEGETVVLHLADGGYSRLVIQWVDTPVLSFDVSASLPRAIAAWKAWRDA